MKGKTVLKDKFKIPNGLQPMVERQARHDADRAGDLQFVDNPYAPGGAKFGFNFATGRAQVTSQTTAGVSKTVEETGSAVASLRGKRGAGNLRPYIRRNTFQYQRGGRYGSHLPYHPDNLNIPVQLPPSHPSRMYPPYRNVRQAGVTNAARGQVQGNRAM